METLRQTRVIQLLKELSVVRSGLGTHGDRMEVYRKVGQEVPDPLEQDKIFKEADEIATGKLRI